MLRVVQWGSGVIGRHALRAAVDHPDLEVVGAFVYRDEQVGRDAGEIGGIGPIGVTATNEPGAILALDADCALYMAQGEHGAAPAIDDICALLGSGKNVVSTDETPLIYPASMGPAVVEQLEEACAAGKTSFHGTGIEPGWASEVLPLTMSGIFRYVESLTVQELLDYSTYDHAPNLFDGMGFGRAPDDPNVLWGEASTIGGFFVAPLMLVADGLEATIEDLSFDRQVWVTDEAFDVAAGRIEVGTVAAMRFSATAVVEGREALTVEHITRLSDEAAPDWPSGRGWKVSIEGRPSMVLEARIGVHGEDHNDQACLGTAMHAVHAVAPVCEAAPGIKTFLDLPMVVGRRILRRPSSGQYQPMR